MHPRTREHPMTARRDAAFTFARHRLCAVEARHHGRDQAEAVGTPTPPAASGTSASSNASGGNGC